MKTLALLSVLVCPVVASAGVIYSGAALPTAEGWTYGTHAPGAVVPTPWGGAVQTVLPAGVQLDTTANQGGYAGYFKQLATGTLDRSAGFQLSFTVAVPQETNSGTTRAGFSVLVLTSDSKAIELAFNNDKIFAQNSTFATFGESVSWNPSALTAYDLEIFGDDYTLRSGGAVLLSGALRTYSPGLTPFAAIYQQQDLVFFGDDTSQASAVMQLQSVAVVPEPGVAGSLLLAAFGLRRVRAR